MMCECRCECIVTEIICSVKDCILLIIVRVYGCKLIGVYVCVYKCMFDGVCMNMCGIS